MHHRIFRPSGLASSFHISLLTSSLITVALLRDRNADVILRPKSANTIVTWYINYGTCQQNKTTLPFPYKIPLSLVSLDPFGSFNIARTRTLTSPLPLTTWYFCWCSIKCLLRLFLWLYRFIKFYGSNHKESYSQEDSSSSWILYFVH